MVCHCLIRCCCCCVLVSFSLHCHHQKADLNMTRRRARTVKMKRKMMMNMKMCLTPTLRKESIPTTIHTGNNTALSGYYCNEWPIFTSIQALQPFVFFHRFSIQSYGLQILLHIQSEHTFMAPVLLEAALDPFRVFMFKMIIGYLMASSLHSWCLMRLAMVQLVLVNLKSFYPMAGYDLLGKLKNTPHTLGWTNAQDVVKCCPISHCLS